VWEWGKSVVPYCYCTFKSKCWASGVHRCTRASQSCLRKIVSYYYVVHKRLLRRAHRGLQLILQRTPSWEIWSLKEAAPVMRSRIASLVRPARFRRCRASCGDVEDPVTCMVIDASQFYEQTSPEDGITAVAWNMAWVTRHTCHDTVSVLDGQGARGSLGGRIPTNGFVPRNVKVMVFGFAELLSLYALCILMTLVQLGNTMWHIPHTPIGNIMGRVTVAAISGRMEIETDLNWQQWRYALEIVSSWTRQQVIALGKYVDDLLGVSHVLCWKCMYLFHEWCLPF